MSKDNQGIYEPSHPKHFPEIEEWYMNAFVLNIGSDTFCSQDCIEISAIPWRISKEMLCKSFI